MMLVITTQFYENYGAHDWDGEGECPQYWKSKGGSEYKVLNVPLNVDYDAIVEAADVTKNNEYVREDILGWELQSDDWLSWFEKSQLEYDGVITCKEPTMEYDELMEAA